MQEFDSNVKFVQEHGLHVEVVKPEHHGANALEQKVKGVEKYLEKNKAKMETIRN